MSGKGGAGWCGIEERIGVWLEGKRNISTGALVVSLWGIFLGLAMAINWPNVTYATCFWFCQFSAALKWSSILDGRLHFLRSAVLQPDD